MIRDDRHDLVYKTRREKYNAIVEETRRLHGLGYPVLVGEVVLQSHATGGPAGHHCRYHFCKRPASVDVALVDPEEGIDQAVQFPVEDQELRTWLRDR